MPTGSNLQDNARLLTKMVVPSLLLQQCKDCQVLSLLLRLGSKRTNSGQSNEYGINVYCGVDFLLLPFMSPLLFLYFCSFFPVLLIYTISLYILLGHILLLVTCCLSGL